MGILTQHYTASQRSTTRL